MVVVPDGAEGDLVRSVQLDGEPLLHHAVRAARLVTGYVVVLTAATDVSTVSRRLGRHGLGPDVLVGARPAGMVGPTSGEGRPAVGTDLAAAVRDALGASGPGDRPAHRALLVVDPLCPLAPAWHLAAVVAELRLPGGGYRAGAAVHPMTDTVKRVRVEQPTRAGVPGVAVAGTVDRETLRVVTSPVLVPVACAGDVPAAADGPALVGALRRAGEVHLLGAPPVARRVHDRAGLHLLVGLREVEERQERRP